MAKSCEFSPNNALLKVKDRRRCVLDCRRCGRLVDWINVQRDKNPDHHNAPVADRGESGGRVLFVGLAPGRLGANRTGRAFVGDSSGDFLFSALADTGFASSADPLQARLQGALVTNVVKCLPPQNQPSRAEIDNCRHHLQRELAAFWRPAMRKPRVIVTLGGLAHRALWQALPPGLSAGRGCPKFGHGSEFAIADKFHLVACFHPSKLNTQTGRLTPIMLRTVLRRVRALVGVASAHEFNA